uniref:PH01B019A14.3 protein n=1 Tax=Phyllostachys edulis TaxID=38705 RepID=L0P1M6_PHYED|nr:PH01B019A14.3 [Phyllostachys edulis]
MPPDDVDYGSDSDRLHDDDLDQMLCDAEVNYSEREFGKFEGLMEDSEKPLFPDCKPEYTRLLREALSTAQSFQGSFQAVRERDMLFKALRNKEHPGRTRGIGLYVPWKDGFLKDSGTYRSRKRAKAERKALLREVATRCKLQVRCASVALDATWGQTYPSGVGALLHGVNIEPGYTKVNVDGGYANFEVVQLEMPPNDEIMTLDQAIGLFIRWPKSNICLELPASVSITSQEVSAPELPAPVSTSHDVPAPKLPTPMR